MAFRASLVALAMPLVFLAGPCFGQALPGQSRFSRQYVPIPFDGDLETMLRARLEQVREWDEIMKKIPDRLKPLLPALENNEHFRQLLLDLLKEDKKAPPAFSPEFLKKALSEKPDKLPMPAEPDKEIKHGPRPVPPQPPPVPGQALPEWTPSPPQENLHERFNRWIKDWMEQTENSDVGALLRDSPAWQQSLEELRRSFENMGGDGDKLPRLWERWPWGSDRLADNLKLPDLDVGWAKVFNLSFPELPRLKVSLPGWGVKNPLAGMGMPALPGPRSAGGGQFWLWLLAGGAALVALWQILRNLERHQARRADGWHPGPWPMSPASVASRADLVACFEYLSLLQLGKEAQSWNHRTIADHLAGNSQDASPREQAARRLAALYEWARYSPGHGPLPSDQASEARRALQFLASMRPS